MLGSFCGSGLFALVGLFIFEILNKRCCRNLFLGFCSLILLIHRARLRDRIGKALQEVNELLILVNGTLPEIFARLAVRNTAKRRKFEIRRAQEGCVFCGRFSIIESRRADFLS